jgi:hypothetical protein
VRRFPTIHALPTQAHNPHLHSFKYQRDDGAPLGPFAALLYTPEYTKTFLPPVRAINKLPISANIRETVILATGSVTLAAYERYAHERVALHTTELTKEQIVGIRDGDKPADLAAEEGIAFDLARTLAKGGGPLPSEIFDEAVRLLGKEQTLAAIHFVGMYAYVSILLNAVDCPLPEGEKLF